jgi:ABC-type multidrug transport system fused ATPase/permease subunit
MIVLTYVVLFIPVHIFGTKRGSVRQQLIRHNALIRQSLLEKLESYKQIKIFGIERKEHEQFSKEQKQWAELTFQENLLTDAFKGFPRIPDSLAPALVFLFVGWQVAAGQATIGELMTVIAFIPAINNPVRLFFMLYITFADIRIRIRGIMEYIQLAEEPGRRDGLLQPADLRNRTISFQDVSVDGNHGPLLKNLTFSIAPGEYVSIVGPSGSGKSTLLKLLTRLQEPSSGEILIGETPLCIMDATCLRQRIGYMTQEGFIFNASLRSNLTYLQPDAPQTLIDGWMQALGAADIVTKLPHGYDTLLGDRGSVLSGGQRQLIGLARTMLKQPDIVLLDEVTSALDQASEAIVYDALNKYTEAAGLTRIAVTHRLQAAVHADRILVVQHGELVEQGTHEALLSLPAGLYARLWHSQLMEQADHSSSLKEEDADAIAIV